jgi:hypothetical protein
MLASVHNTDNFLAALLRPGDTGANNAAVEISLLDADPRLSKTDSSRYVQKHDSPRRTEGFAV